MKILVIGAVVGVMGFAISAASAAPVQPTMHTGNSSIILAQGRDHHGDRDRRRDHRPHFVPGRRYNAPPHGWRRYSRRPGDWRTRGCILVGPIWFCP